MTFDQLAEYVAVNSRPDGDTVLEVPKEGPYYGTPYSSRLARILRMFTTETPLLFAAMQPITIDAGVREFDLTNATKCPLAFWDVRRLWINDQPIARLDSAVRIMTGWTTAGPVGAPNLYAHIDRTKIVFNNKPVALLTGCYAQGWYRHPEITAGTTVIHTSVEDRLELFDRYAQANLREYVASDEVGMARLQKVDAEAAEALKQIRGDTMKTFLGSVGYPK